MSFRCCPDYDSWFFSTDFKELPSEFPNQRIPIEDVLSSDRKKLDQFPTVQKPVLFIPAHQTRNIACANELILRTSSSLNRPDDQRNCTTREDAHKNPRFQGLRYSRTCPICREEITKGSLSFMTIDWKLENAWSFTSTASRCSSATTNMPIWPASNS